MWCSLRCLLILLAALAATADIQADSKGPPKPHFPKPHLPKAPPLPKPHIPKPPPLPRHPPTPHLVRRPAIPMSHPRVNRHPRPAVHHHAIRRMPHSPIHIARQPVRRTVVRTIHRYPVHRVPYRFARRRHYFGVYPYAYSYYPGRHRLRTNYNRGYGALQRRRARVVGGIVQSVQGNPGNGTLLVKVFRPRSGRFR